MCDQGRGPSGPRMLPCATAGDFAIMIAVSYGDPRPERAVWSEAEREAVDAEARPGIFERMAALWRAGPARRPDSARAEPKAYR